ncbi:hypothetical protein BV25DRAFT_1821386 [Artomyces pyxidatus]|uniref:Uncharacterized protein n=1 Tax=Artomyces pyxidatus TaxID=48021 RepID=A0ACB8TA72_9AGAM|nr:hypothetical protein BV25DRAFT_1821386 [Artomyces pyxidatus]
MSIFSLLGTLPKLRRLNLTFYSYSLDEPQGELAYDAWTEASRDLKFQRAALASLESLSSNVSSTQHLECICLNHVVYLAHDVFSRPTFVALFAGVQELRFLAIGHRENQENFQLRPVFDFWSTNVPPLLHACRTTLTSLNLGSLDEYVSSAEGLSLQDLYFPVLRTLDLSNIIFDAQSHVEEFVVRHCSTLKSLSLSDCKIPCPMALPPTRTWADVYRRFSDELGMLEVFEVIGDEELADGSSSSLPWRTYARWNLPSPLRGWNEYFEDEEGPRTWGLDDDVALERLVKIAKERKSNAS